jgi:hypothetical protein
MSMQYEYMSMQYEYAVWVSTSATPRVEHSTDIFPPLAGVNAPTERP